MHLCFSYIFALRMILRFIISSIVVLVTFFVVEERLSDCEFASVVCGQLPCEASIEEVVTLTVVGSESLPHLDGMRRFHRNHSIRIGSGGNTLAKVNIHLGVCPSGRCLNNNIHLSDAAGIGKVDSYIFWRNLRI